MKKTRVRDFVILSHFSMNLSRIRIASCSRAASSDAKHHGFETCLLVGKNLLLKVSWGSTGN